MQIQNALITGSFSYNGADLSNITSSNAYSASLSSRTTDLESTASVLVGASSSFSSILTSVSSSQQQISSSLLTLTASYNALSASYTALSASYNTASSSFSTRITSDSSSMSSRTTQIENVYASTGSNTFTGLQNFSNTCTPNSFTAGASIYTAGGLQVTQDSYFSSSVFIKGNVTVFGTQSVSYISSSQLDIGTNIITVNTSTPSVRYGGLSVFDSGSTGLTGSIFWDSELNRWIYVNASGSGGGATYGGGMFISGPRNSVGLGCEQGTTACMLLVGQGGDHLTSSMIYHDSTVTCIPNNLIGSTICSTIVNASCIGIGTTSPATKLNIRSDAADDGILLEKSDGTDIARLFYDGTSTNARLDMFCGGSAKVQIHTNGTSHFSGGNVGIGTSSPNFKTHISTGDAASITQPTAGTYGLYVQQNTSGNVGGLYIQDGASNSGNSIFVGDNNGAARFVVNTDGLVGIGTNTFTYDTRSAGFAYQGSVGTLYFRTTGAEIYTYNVNAYFGSGTSGYSTIIMSGAGTTALTLASNQTATFASSICATAATFSGKVLINGSGATAQLDITSDASANGITLRNRTGDDYAFFNWRTLGGTELLAEQYIQRTAANTAVMKYTIANACATPAVYLTIASTGVATFACQICVKEAVYINGSFPGVKLDRAGTTAQSDINWKDAGTSVWSIGTAVRAVGSSLDFYSYCTGDNVFKLTQTGITCFSNTVCAPRVDLNRCNASTVLSVGNEDSTEDAGVRGLAISTNRLRFGVSPATSTYGTIATNGTNSGITFVTYDNAWTEKMRIACNGDLTIKGNTHCIYTNSAATISFDINVTRGRFYQALTVDGAITKGGGSFKIDHPLESKKDTYNLYHSFVESPKADLIYRGKVTLINGYATVNIDTAADMSEGTFEVLVKDVQCFTTNENGWNFVKGTISGNILTIESDNTNCNDEISWMVIGERNDKWFRESTMVDENGKTIVEKLKSETT